MAGLRIAGTGSYLPGPPLDRDTLRTFLRQYPDGLSEREQDYLIATSGIEQRHYAVDVIDPTRRESNTSMATAAARRALDAAGWEPSDIDLLVVTTVVPDQLMPPTSTLVQEALGIERCAEIGLSANCTGPTKGLMIAASQLELGRYRRALVACSQFASFGFLPPWANPAQMAPNQGHLRWILSDGAAAVALEEGEPDIQLRFALESTGIGKRSGFSLALGAMHPDLQAAYATGSHHASQDPRYALREGIPLAREGLRRMLQAFEVPAASIAHFIPSISSMQVARRLQAETDEFGIRSDAWRLNFTRVGYVGSVAVLIMLDELARTGQLRPGDIVCTSAEESSKWMYAGSLFRWNPERR